MAENINPLDKLVHELKERAKELNCLYEVQELLGTPDITIDEICLGIIKALPPGWQYPDVCGARIVFDGVTYQTPGFKETPWVQSADIDVQDQTLGKISVCYTEDRPISDEGPFLKEERKLINTIAEQFGFFILHQQLRQVFQEQLKSEEERKSEWGVILDLLRRTDPGLLMRISSKMVNFLYWNGVKEAEQLLKLFSPVHREESELIDENRPNQRQPPGDILEISDEVFTIASQHLTQAVILENIQRWIKEDRSSFLVDILVNPGSSLAEISSAIERFNLLTPQGIELTAPRAKWFRTALIRRILSDQPPFLKVAKEYIDISDFSEFMHRVIFPAGSHGMLGGKSSGLFLAEQILNQSLREKELLQSIKTPKTWYLTSDSVFYFIGYNNLEDVVEQKYKDLSQVRQEYPYIVHVFKNSSLPPEIIKGLSLALDDFGDVPLIVRSSSLLEDRTGAAFAGKYKSLFIANKGKKEERLQALIDAIAEVYASMFGPDPIEYRYKNGLIDDHEEMGVLIQEVVGRQVGHYYMPAFAGVAFSQNDFPWSSRIRREDGLVRLVPGLGTRAVDRLSDDYPSLVSPGQPRLRVNVSLDEVVRYSPKKIDVINLQTKTFETVEIRQLLKEFGQDYPLVKEVVSILRQDRILMPSALGVDFDKDECVVTFEGLISRTPFLKQIGAILHVLEETLGYPVDIEFAHDGVDFYLLQCRAQSYGQASSPAEIPKDTPPEKVIFTANRYITNGSVPDITHIVYVDPIKYSELTDQQEMVAVGRAVGSLNKSLPRRQFILMGPGRWGSRGDIKLGVSVTYSDINNTAMLIEIARKQKDYIPDPSFGTHFFQDLVEASIYYLPLYPDERCVVFNEQFLTTTPNILTDMLPNYASLSDVIRVIDVPAATGGQILQVLMNADVEQAIARLNEPSLVLELEAKKSKPPVLQAANDVHWRWRLQAAERIAAHLDSERLGVKALYIFGSSNNATAGPASDIDLLVHFQGSESQRQELLTWLEGWSLSLAEMNYLRTGYKTGGLLDVHLVTDKDIENRASFATKIGAISDAARPLAVGSARRRNGN
ncbi:MAG: nucleotidyltransferase domain-containing protein [Anaerolineales bacterium]|nr:nucleotidyltransferase domain-containing protein [Anaerolineales bacterium]